MGAVLRLLHVSDTHGSGSHERGLITYVNAQPSDLVVVHTGDIQTNRSSPPWHEWRPTLSRRTRLFVPGNHDCRVRVGSPLRNWTQSDPPWCHAVDAALFLGLDSEARKSDGSMTVSYDEQAKRLEHPIGEYRDLVVLQHRWPDEECQVGSTDPEPLSRVRDELRALKDAVSEIRTRADFERVVFCTGHYHRHSPRWITEVPGFAVPASLSRVHSQEKSNGAGHLLTLSDSGVEFEPIEGIRTTTRGSERPLGDGM